MNELRDSVRDQLCTSRVNTLRSPQLVCSCSCSPALPLACSTASPHSPMRSAPVAHWSSSPSSVTTSTVCTSVEFNWRLVCQVKAGGHDSISISISSTSTMRVTVPRRHCRHGPHTDSVCVCLPPNSVEGVSWRASLLLLFTFSERSCRIVSAPSYHALSCSEAQTS